MEASQGQPPDVPSAVRQLVAERQACAARIAQIDAILREAREALLLTGVSSAVRVPDDDGPPCAFCGHLAGDHLSDGPCRSPRGCDCTGFEPDDSEDVPRQPSVPLLARPATGATAPPQDSDSDTAGAKATDVQLRLLASFKGGPARLSALVAGSGLTHQTASTLVQRLLKRGLVRKAARGLYEITPAGSSAGRCGTAR